MPTGIQRVVLSWPTHLVSTDLKSDGEEASAASWMQIARTGNFVSQRYGKFSITKDDLAQMLNNFRNITPKAPTRLPVDYDHLSMDPKKPGDGMAAGWMKDLELRADGEELWGLVEWTPDAAVAIKKKQYQFVSPSFVKDYIYKDGNEIGTTLLAAAITNHPFLEGMAALTLSAGLPEMGIPLSLAEGNPFAKKAKGAAEPAADDDESDDEAADGSDETGAAPMEVGQKVAIKDDEVQKPEQIGVTFIIEQVVGEGADAFVSLRAPDGSIAEWFRADELQPAPAERTVADPNAQVPAAPAVTMASAVPPVATTNLSQESPMKTFDLTDVNGNKVTIGEEILNEIAQRAVPAGHVVINAAEYEETKNQVVALSSQLETMAQAAAKAEHRARISEMHKELDRLSNGGFITRPERSWAEKMFGGEDVKDLSGFKEWASTKTTPIVRLHAEHGSGLGGSENRSEAEIASQQLMDLANTIQKRDRISLREAMIRASREMPNAATTYRESFATTA